MSLRLLPMPFAVWKVVAALAEVLPSAPLTRNQVDLMREDNVTWAGVPGLGELSIKPMDIDQSIRMIGRAK
ncbi:NADH dehydrogenase [Mesorhizobium sp. NFR06]|nr:NADH dehydrogenase [Mesorhizobium sp. NFR06]